MSITNKAKFMAQFVNEIDRFIPTKSIQTIQQI